MIHKSITTVFGAAIIATLTSTVAQAFVSLEGYFIAEVSCDAYQSKNKRTNPGDIVTNEDQAYEILGLNKEAGDFFQIRIDDAPVTTARWVHVDCGIHVVKAGTSTGSGGVGPVVITPPAGEESTDNLLALSWQPAFCEQRPNKIECRQLNDGLLPITEQQLSIHGLWPQPRNNVYCGVSSALINLDEPNTWGELPVLDLTPETREELEVAMPGTASFLHRHEWIKHGTCFLGDGGAEEYYRDTLIVTAAINNSPIATFLEEHVGSSVDTQEIRDLFDETFGAGAGDRVQFQCKGDGGRTLIQELKINLAGVISEDASVSDLLLNASTTSRGCPRGVIDPAGLQ